MYRIYMAMIEIIASSIFILPIFFFYHKFVFRNTSKRTCWYILLAFYFVAILALVGFPNITYFRLDITLNLIPFVNIPADFKNACLNILLFLPLGIFLPVLWEKYRQLKNILYFGLCLTCMIEIVQIFTFRTTDINDILMNSVGTWVGYWIIKSITKNFAKYESFPAGNKELYLILGTVIAVMFFIQPFVLQLFL